MGKIDLKKYYFFAILYYKSFTLVQNNNEL